jgi:hypothetical protein
MRKRARGSQKERKTGNGPDSGGSGRKSPGAIVGTLLRPSGFAGTTEAQMPDREKPISNKRASGSDKAVHPSKEGGSQQQKAQEWGGGSKASKGKITPADKRNENSSAKGR